MAIFYKRPLALACLVLILCVVLAAVLPLAVCLALLVAAGVLFLLSLVFFWRRRSVYRRLWLMLLALASLLGLGRVFFERYAITGVIAPHVGSEVTAVVAVESVEYRSAYGSELLVEIEALNGEACGVIAVVQTDVLTPFGLGDRIQGTFLVIGLESEEIDASSRSSYLAGGATALLVPLQHGELQLLESGNGSFAAVMEDYRYRLHNTLTDAVGGSAGELLGAMLLGTRNDLDRSVVRDFRRTGLSHLLAISGLHLAILAGIVEWTLRRLGLGKRSASVILVLFGLLYLILTGFSYSMLRAVIMLAILRGSLLTGGDNDTLTSLLLGGALIVSVTPSAVFDLSFQMTMLATFGIVAFGALQTGLMRRFPHKKGIRGVCNRVICFVPSSLCVTLSATLLLLPIQWVVFGELSLIAPLANLSVALLAAPLLALGLPMLLLVMMGLPCTVLALPAGCIARLMLRMDHALAEGNVVLSLRQDFAAYVFVPVFVATAILLCVRLKRHLQPLVAVPAVLGVLTFSILLFSFRAANADELQVIYRTTGSNDALLLYQNGQSVICDLSAGSLAQLNADYALLKDLGSAQVDVLLLTHYHSSQAAAVAKFSYSNVLRRLWVPKPETEQDSACLIELLAVALAHDVAVTVYDRGEALHVFATGSITVSQMLYEARSVEPAYWLEVAFGNETVRYQSAAYGEYAQAQGVPAVPDGTTYLIFGGHGPNPHATVHVPAGESLREVWFSNEKSIVLAEPVEGIRYVICPEERELILE